WPRVVRCGRAARATVQVADVHRHAGSRVVGRSLSGESRVRSSTSRPVAGVTIAGVLAATLLGLAQGSPDSARTATKRFDMRVVTSGLESPWEVALGPDG